jgi:enamine deaminase RidA (YjgF/YER057c/UK114 family)
VKNHFSSGSPFEEKAAYSRAIAIGNTVFVSGTTGFDYKTMQISDSIAEQTEKCFQNIAQALEAVGSKMDDIVKVQYIVPVAEEFQLCWPVIRKYLGTVKPAATMISANLLDDRMKIEIEVTAVKDSKS